MTQHNDELVGIGEIAEIAGVSRQAVRPTGACVPQTFPALLLSWPLGQSSGVRRFELGLRRNKRNTPMAHVISTINLKGGVAKTTTSVALAEIFSSEMGKKVLVIDLDPQTNANDHAAWGGQVA